MTIIVTGGAGFIGSNFILYMLNKYPDYCIICLLNFLERSSFYGRYGRNKSSEKI